MFCIFFSVNALSLLYLYTCLSMPIAIIRVYITCMYITIFCITRASYCYILCVLSPPLPLPDVTGGWELSQAASRFFSHPLHRHCIGGNKIIMIIIYSDGKRLAIYCYCYLCVFTHKGKELCLSQK